MDKVLRAKIADAIRNGLSAKSTGSRCGCGRAYVCLGKVDKGVLAAYKAAAKDVGVRYLTNAYGSGSRVLYIGYDNADGVAPARADAIADNLRALGLPAYSDGVAD